MSKVGKPTEYHRKLGILIFKVKQQESILKLSSEVMSTQAFSNPSLEPQNEDSVVELSTFPAPKNKQGTGPFYSSNPLFHSVT